MVPDSTNHAKVCTMLGKRVRVTLNRGGYPDKNTVSVVAEGKLLGFGDEGTFELLLDDGFTHYCWPMLDIEEVPSVGNA